MPLKRSKEISKGGLITVVEQQVTNVPLYEYLVTQNIVRVTIPVNNYYRGVLDHTDFTINSPEAHIIEVRPSKSALSDLDPKKSELIDQPLYREEVSSEAEFDISQIELDVKQKPNNDFDLLLDLELPEAIKSGPQKLLADRKTDDSTTRDSEIDLDDISSLLPDELEIEFTTNDLIESGFQSLVNSLKLTIFEAEVIRAMLVELVDEYASSQNYNFDTEMSILVANAISKMISTEYDAVLEASHD